MHAGIRPHAVENLEETWRKRLTGKTLKHNQRKRPNTVFTSPAQETDHLLLLRIRPQNHFLCRAEGSSGGAQQTCEICFFFILYSFIYIYINIKKKYLYFLTLNSYFLHEKPNLFRGIFLFHLCTLACRILKIFINVLLFFWIQRKRNPQINWSHSVSVVLWLIPWTW